MTIGTVDLNNPDLINRNWEAFIFPDGQPHVSVEPSGGKVMEIVSRITTPDELFRVLLVGNALQNSGVEFLNLTITYLMGGRMDRSMPTDDKGMVQPFTLEVVANTLCVPAYFRTIRVFDPHSSVSLELLEADAVLPYNQVGAALALLPKNVVLVVPDKGAVDRVEMIANHHGVTDIAYLAKTRDPNTGRLSNFQFARDIDRKLVHHRFCLIVDDIIDGGRTFTGAATVLRDAGADAVNLYVSHGIFSAGYVIPGIDRIFTTDSYQNFDGGVPNHVTVFPWRI